MTSKVSSAPKDVRSTRAARRARDLPRGKATKNGWRGSRAGAWEDAKLSGRARKGKRYQGEARRILEADGYLVHEVHPVLHRRADQYWTVYEDIWHAIDLAATSSGGGFVFVQVTTEDNASHKRRDLERIPWPLENDGYRVELWLRRRGGFRICPYLPGRRGREAWPPSTFRPLLRVQRPRKSQGPGGLR